MQVARDYTLSAGARPEEVPFAELLQSQSIPSIAILLDVDVQCIAHPVWYVGIFIPLVLVIRCQLYLIHVPQLLQDTCVAKPSERIRTHSLSETAAKDCDISQVLSARSQSSSSATSVIRSQPYL